MAKSITRRVTENFITAAVFLMLASSLRLDAAVPVISDIKIIGGARGIALSIIADASFEAQFANTGTNSVKITINNAVYGLNTFSYTSSRSGTLIKITTQELNNASVQITVSMEKTVAQTIETQHHGNQWVALLTRDPVNDFKWSASEFDSKNSEPVSKPAVPNTAPVKNTKTQDSTNSDISLVNVKCLQRNTICSLHFEFNKTIQSAIKRSKDSVFIQVANARNGVDNSKIFVPKGTPFRSILIKEKMRANTPLLDIVVVLDEKNIVQQKGIATSKGNVITLVANSTGEAKIAQWTSGNGPQWEHTFYNLPSQKIDTQSIVKRAAKEAAVIGNEDSAFFVKDESSDGKDAAAAQASKAQIWESAKKTKTPENTSGPGNNRSDLPGNDAIANSAVSQNARTEGASEEEINAPVKNRRAPLIVTSNNVNLRSKPNGNGEVVSKLALGNKLEILELHGQWYNVRYNTVNGWIHQKFVKDSSAITPKMWKEINASLPVIPEKSETPVIGIPMNNGEASNVRDSILGTDSSSKYLQKQTVKYNEIGRDPFRPLASDTVDDNSENAKVEKLRLVGILFDKDDRMALFEDTKAGNKPFALRENDAVEHGKVLKIYKDKVVFLITEYGISRSYNVRLATKQEQEAGKQ